MARIDGMNCPLAAACQGRPSDLLPPTYRLVGRCCSGAVLTLALLCALMPAVAVAERIQLGAFADPDRGWRHWQRLRSDYPPLQRLQPCLLASEHRGQPLYRLQLEGDSAGLLCAQLQARGESCYPVTHQPDCHLSSALTRQPPALNPIVSPSEPLPLGPRLQLGAYRLRANAIDRWQQLRRAQPQLLTGAQACLQVYLSPLRPAPLFRLQVFAVDGLASDPYALCNRLRSAGVDCTVVLDAAASCEFDSALQSVPEAALTERAAGESRGAARSREESAPRPLSSGRLLPPVLPPEGAPAPSPLPPAEITGEDLMPTAVAEGVSMLPRKIQQRSLVEFDIDDPPSTRRRITEALSYGAKLSHEFEMRQDRDLDHEADDRLLVALPELSVALAYNPDARFLGYAELELKKLYRIDDPEDRGHGNVSLQIDQLYLLWDNPQHGWSMQLGRQEFKDEREWLYDQQLDGLRFYYRRHRLGAELSLSREDLFERDLFNHDDTDPVDNLMLLGRFAYADDGYLDAYLLWRNSRDAGEPDLRFAGLRGLGELSRRVDYWFEAALLEGDEDGESIRGYGVDVGLIWAPKWRWRPALTLGWALGSGDPDDPERGFRQTGLQDNNDRFNGVSGIQYYGEAFDPELSNLRIFTLGLGVRPADLLSLDLVYHRYAQQHALDEIFDSEVDLDPDGVHTDLGDALDLVIGYRIGAFSIDWINGIFWPGAAFPNTADKAYFAEFKFSWRY